LTKKIQCYVIQAVIDELKVKDDNKGMHPASPPHPPILLSKDTHALDEVIVHDSIIAQAIELVAHKNNNLDIPHHKTRFFSPSYTNYSIYMGPYR
jgi:hypothetical protein